VLDFVLQHFHSPCKEKTFMYYIEVAYDLGTISYACKGDLVDQWSQLLSARAQIDAIEEMKSCNWPEVEEFREEWLPYGGEPFSDREEARNWLKRKAKMSNLATNARVETEETTRYMKKYEPEAIKYDEYPTPRLLDSKGIRNKIEIGFHFDDLDFAPYVVQTRPYGFFAAVISMGSLLSKREGWTEHSARAWLITEDARPIIWALKISDPRLVRHRKLVRVTIDVALDTPPHVLAAAFAFVVPRNDGRGWQSILEQWNAIQPKDWRFENTDLLGRSAKKAYKTLMGRKMDWRGPRGAASHRR
jgi:hypothetical protein